MQPERRGNLFSGLFIIIGSVINSSRLMNICCTILASAVAVSCSVSDPAKMGDLQNGNMAVPSSNSNAPHNNPPVKNVNLNTTAVKNGNAITLDCGDPNGFRLVVVTDPGRASQNLGTAPRILNIVAGDEIKAAIKIPTDADAQGFSLESTEKTKEGFKITIEYGTRHYYQKQFNFICEEGALYLYKMSVVTFDKFDPASGENPERKEIKVNPKLPIEKFSIFDYLAN